jgi:tryptophan synthase alpha chain
MNKPLMCHVVAGYPDPEACLQLLAGMSRLGVAALEVQIPFSDPIADGPVIMGANDVALAGGMTTAGSFELIERAREQGVDTDLYTMSYLQKVQHFGLAEFCRRAADCGVNGLIVPDMPYDSPEFTSLRQLAADARLDIVPVVSPGMSEARLRAILSLKPKTLYVTSRRGITGSKYSPQQQLKQFVAGIKKLSDARLMIGFGIATPDDVRNARGLGDLAVVGSAIINKLQASGIDETLEYIGSLAAVRP